jgi:hypothetical protein
MQKKFFYGVENGRLLYFYLFYLKVSPLKTAWKDPSHLDFQLILLELLELIVALMREQNSSRGMQLVSYCCSNDTN